MGLKTRRGSKESQMHRFERLKVIGRGNYGIAILVRDRAATVRGPGGQKRRQLHVVKEVQLGDGAHGSASDLKEACREAEVLRSLSHSNIVAYRDAFVEGRTLHIVMEYAGGGDLQGAI